MIAEELPIHFQSLDLNRVELEPGYFDVIYAVASIHHILNLEHLFAQLHRGLKDDGRLVIVDIIGKTQVEFWRENVEYAARVVKRLPARYSGRRAGPGPLSRLFFDPYTVIWPLVEPEIQRDGGNSPGRDRAAARTLVSPLAGFLLRRIHAADLHECGDRASLRPEKRR